MKLFRQDRDPIECSDRTFLSPTPAPVFFSARLISRAVNDFSERINSVSDQKVVFPLRSFVLWPGLKQRMHMIRHDADSEEFVTRIVKMTPCVQHNRASLRIKVASMLRCVNSHGINRPWFFEMRETTARVMSARC